MEFPDSPCLSIRPNHSSLFASLRDCIQCPSRADVFQFLQISQDWCAHVYVSMKERHLWVWTYVSSSVLNV